MTRVFISRDAASLSLGAARIARLIGEESLVRDLALEIVATGSRGMFWLEPLVEVETPEGRVAYGPVSPADIGGLFEADFLYGRGTPFAPRPPGGHALPRQAAAVDLRPRAASSIRCRVDDYEAHGG